MAKKEAQPAKTLTRRQLALSRREREQLRLIYWGLGLVGVLILIVLAIGLIQTYIIEPNSPVAIINGQEISTQEYQNRVLYERFLLDSQIEQMRQQLAALPAEAEQEDQLTQLLRNQYQQFGAQLIQQRRIVDRQTLDAMIEDKLVQAEAGKRNITVSEDEVTEQINRILANRAGGLTAAAVSETSTARAEASATAAVWTPTPTFTPSPTLTTTQAITEPTATPENTPTPGPTPTPNIISAESLSQQYTEWLQTLANGAGTDEARYRQYIRVGLLRNKLREAIGDEAPREAEQAHARHILVETKEEAEKVIERLKAGEAFADLAVELSKDKQSGAQGGDLGFVPRGQFVQPVEEAIFSLPIGQISEPIETQFGWHVIEVLEREVRELSPTDYSVSQRAAYDDWLTKTRETAQIEDLWTVDKAPREATVGQEF
jgi:parvulin-like peptidyl-prolyl isomerase